MKVNNPYLDAKRDILKQMYNTRDQNKLKILDAKYKEIELKIVEYNNNLLEKLSGNLADVKKLKTKIKKTEINPKEQYNKFIKLYRYAMKQAREISHIKKEMRESFALDKQKNKTLSEVL